MIQWLMIRIFGNSELNYIYSHSLEIAGLLIASRRAIKSGNQTIIDQLVGSTTIFLNRKDKSDKELLDAIKKVIENGIIDKWDYVSGFVCTAIGILISTFFDTVEPADYAMCRILLWIIMWIWLFTSIAKVSCKIRTKSIMKGLIRGDLRFGDIDFNNNETTAENSKTNKSKIFIVEVREKE